MPKLHWIGKEKVVSHHLDVPFHVLRHAYGFTAEGGRQSEPTESGNVILHGDNLVALKSLLPQYEGRVKCIYIDPPYNTGNEGWVYNDRVNEPHILKWLGEVVGKMGEDLSRHDKWLCMMYPRLALLRQLLADDGAIFISIDDNELANLKLLCDEIFGERNFIGQWHWFKSATPPNLSYKIKKNLEYVLCYEKHKTSFKYKGIQKTSPSDDPLIKPQNTLKVLSFPPKSVHFKKANGTYTAGIYGTTRYPNKLLSDIQIEDGVNTNEIRFENRFIWTQEKLEEELRKGTKINCSKALVLSYKKAAYDPEVPPNLIDESCGVDTTEEAGKQLQRIFATKAKVFDYPKDPSLIAYLINFLCGPDDIVLDSFAGSGTTAHAVLNLNKQDGGHRKFILVELLDYAEDITAERVRRVMQGYGEGDKAVEGTGGAFDFYEIGEPLFSAPDVLNEAVGEAELRKYIYFSETRRELRRPQDAAEKYLLDVNEGTAYYFCYEPGHATTLDADSLADIRTRAEHYIIYADVCLLDEAFMQRHNIVFKKIPRDIRKF